MYLMSGDAPTPEELEQEEKLDNDEIEDGDEPDPEEAE